MLRALTFAALLAATPAAAADRIDGTPVIETLEAAKLAPGQIHRFWFRAEGNSVAQGWYVPVIVIRGAKPGPRLLLTAAVHGDELNGVDVIHRLAAKIDPATLSGTIVGIPGVNVPGLIHHTRGFTPGDGRDGENLNRIMPGKPDGSIGERYAHRIWTRLLRGNADTVIDLHTQSRGTAYVMYAFAATPRAQAIANLLGPDIVKLDPGVEGTVELEMIQVGIPAVTLELGRPEEFDPVMNARAVAGIERVMVDMGMLPKGMAPAPTATPFTANAIQPVYTRIGGFARLLVTLGSDVVQGQPVATVSDPFGRIVETVAAPVSGRVNTIATDPLREPGATLLRIVFTSTDPKCATGC